MLTLKQIIMLGDQHHETLGILKCVPSSAATAIPKFNCPNVKLVIISLPQR
uniref:Uncharacterized protein n=1 Tax=Arion vulgaris TaxID=1028688 RepID=A0A0B7AL23_9EUPU